MLQAHLKTEGFKHHVQERKLNTNQAQMGILVISDLAGAGCTKNMTPMCTKTCDTHAESMLALAIGPGRVWQLHNFQAQDFLEKIRNERAKAMLEPL